MPFSLSKAESNKLSKLDENSVIMSRIPYTTEYDYHVTAIASYAINNEEKPEIFNSQIKWLIENIDKDGAYRHKFKFSYYSNFPNYFLEIVPLH